MLAVDWWSEYAAAGKAARDQQYAILLRLPDSEDFWEVIAVG